MKTKIPVLALLLCGAPAALVSTGCVALTTAAQRPPTSDQIKDRIRKEFTQVYMVNDGNAHPDKVNIEFGEMQIGSGTMMAGMLARDDPPRLIFPVRVPVAITVTYSNNPAVRHVERGTTSNDVFLFYVDAFQEWNFKTGSL